MKRTITVTGSGSAAAVPDLVTLTLGVETRRETAAKAYDDAGKSAAAVAAGLRAAGVADADLRTSGLNLRADLVWVEGQGQKVTAYVASTTLHVGIRSHADAPAAIAAAVAAGGDDIRINGLEQGHADPSRVTGQAQEAAWQDAVTRAEQYATLASAHLGSVVSISQQPAQSGPIPLAGMVRASYAAEALPVEAGESVVSASVTVEWELI
ncbi:SIMPL domain-containing protein [Paenarthrobacter nitroguajacolicus]|uniref:SIMPL domain-containing protein n=1 Tax=Paenarthrobacter nitroguajacolicus TaxID=211146 RepID=UPI00248C9B01|nr:SIMPL domain-containing protein [Paenarthrobacter nitroguajacolicus]MDI2036127.1 26 kDa periplasmic immunogenic protein [Paenarthrobacter nitroguajacolicus]